MELFARWRHYRIERFAKDVESLGRPRVKVLLHIGSRLDLTECEKFYGQLVFSSGTRDEQIARIDRRVSFTPFILNMKDEDSSEEVLGVLREKAKPELVILNSYQINYDVSVFYSRPR